MDRVLFHEPSSGGCSQAFLHCEALLTFAFIAKGSVHVRQREYVRLWDSLCAQETVVL